MATHDVPGVNPQNGDDLHVGCWAEHDDGSLLFVKGAENFRIIFELFDFMKTPITVWTSALSEKDFKAKFTDSKDKWLWHDKKPFPWDRVISAGYAEGETFASAHDQISAAERVKESLKERVEERALDVSKYEHLGEKTRHRVSRAIKAGLGAAFAELRD